MDAYVLFVAVLVIYDRCMFFTKAAAVTPAVSAEA
jgi:hypothetical protein